MPLVRVATKGAPSHSAKQIGAIVARAIIDVLYVPGNPKMQVITEYSADPLTYLSSEGETERDDLAVIEIALADGRNAELKNRFYGVVFDRLARDLGISPANVFINLVEIKKESWAWRNT